MADARTVPAKQAGIPEAAHPPGGLGTPVGGVTPRTVLIEGAELADLMIEHGVGVTVSDVYKVGRVDLDYFVADDEDGGSGATRGDQPGTDPRRARENVIDALREVLAVRFGQAPELPDPSDVDSLELTIAA